MYIIYIENFLQAIHLFSQHSFIYLKRIVIDILF